MPQPRPLGGLLRRRSAADLRGRLAELQGCGDARVQPALDPAVDFQRGWLPRLCGMRSFDSLTAAGCDELFRINTAPLPSRALAAPSTHHAETSTVAADDQAVHLSATSDRAVERKAISSSTTVDVLPTRAFHEEDWPQDRPIAKALANNFGLC